MRTEHWALLVSILALFASIGIPVWQSWASGAQARAARRSLLLQTVLSAKSTTFVAMHELLHLLHKHGGHMDKPQRENLEAMIPRMRKHHDELEKLHDAWSDFEDGASLKEIEAALAHANVTDSDATDTAKLIENGRRSYEEN